MALACRGYGDVYGSADREQCILYVGRAIRCSARQPVSVGWILLDPVKI